MSGHSKWSTIKRKKGKTDAERGKIFTKIGREIAIAVKDGGPSPDQNSKLKDVIAKAKAANMPNDNIMRSIKKASGEDSNVHYEEIVYEGYGPGGIAVIVEAVTDNRNRTAGEIRHLFDKYGGSLGVTGCVGWMFDSKGVLIVENKDNIDDEEFMMMLLEAGAEDFSLDEDVYEVITDIASFSATRENLEKQNMTFLSASLEKLPQNTVEPAYDILDRFTIMLEKLEDHDDVQNVYHNAELPEDYSEED